MLHIPDGGLDADSVAVGEQVRTIAKSRLTRQRGALLQAALVQLNRALAIALDLSP